MKYKIILGLLLTCFVLVSYGQTYQLKGVVFSAKDSLAIEGASIDIMGVKTKTDKLGVFRFDVGQKEGKLRVSHLGYEDMTLEFALPQSLSLRIYLKENVLDIDHVVVSTGYEEIPAERATGSFEVIDNKLLNRSSDMNILKRLEHVTSGIHYSPKSNAAIGMGIKQTPVVNIHGINTIQGANLRSAPLIILDNFPYDGDISDINANDMESVTVLKDAAAASIWGAKAGNGVIVLTSKKGAYEQPMKLSFTANFNVDDKPDLMKHQVISPAEIVEVEKFLFEKGFYKSKESNRAKTALPPVIELLIAQRDGQLTEEEAQSKLELYKSQDVRDDFLKYFYRKSLQQQYFLNASGGGSRHKYSVGAGHDKALSVQRGRDYNRTSVRLLNSFKPIKNLEVTAGLHWNYIQIWNTARVPVYSENTYKFPYAKLVDDNGNSLPVPEQHRLSYVDTAGRGKLLDWYYRPFDEMRNPLVKENNQALVVNAGLNYNIMSWLNGDIKYQYTKSTAIRNALLDLKNYDTRNNINLGTEFDGDNVIYHFPYGDILEKDYTDRYGHNARFQLNINKRWKDANHFYGILGFEINESQISEHGYTIYGYNQNTLSYPYALDHIGQFPIYDNLATSGTVPSPLHDQTEMSERLVSFFSNASYTYKGKYILSGSARRDASNLFGVATNDKWSPFWSAGFKWNLSDEQFYSQSLFSKLAVRLTYGYSGNVDNSISAVPTMSYLNNNWIYKVPYLDAQLLNAPNANLRWEKVRNINIGLDFASASNRISGSFDLYFKHTEDLYVHVPLDPTVGIGGMVVNGGNTKGRGIDLRLRSVNINSPLRWETNWLFSYNNNWLTKNYLNYVTPSDVLTNGIARVEGFIAFPVYSYKWGGLDPDTGLPLGILNGEPSKDYRALRNAEITVDDLVFHGSSRPLYWGVVRNSFNYRNLTLSANISWKAGYYFRRNTVNYSQLLNSTYAHTDYYKRWQKPGDEKITHVPAFIYPLNSNAASFYNMSEVLVEKGDHIRLEDIRLDYTVVLKKARRLNLHAQVDNLGVIWKATKIKEDPTYNNFVPVPRHYSLGINFTY